MKIAPPGKVLSNSVLGRRPGQLQARGIGDKPTGDVWLVWILKQVLDALLQFLSRRTGYELGPQLFASWLVDLRIIEIAAQPGDLGIIGESIPVGLWKR